MRREPRVGIGPTTSFLPRTRSADELPRRVVGINYAFQPVLRIGFAASLFLLSKNYKFLVGTGT